MKLRGALLGTGNIALKGHAPQWANDEQLRDEIEIVAVADLSPSNREAALAFFPRARAYPSAEELLREERLDFCDVCTPPFTHRSLVEFAAERRVNLLCEKPLAPSLEDAIAIARAVREAEVVFQPCHQYHYSPQWQAVKRLLPRLGRVYLADYQVHRLAANEGNPHWTPRWRTDRVLAGGGILVDHGAHIFYQLRSVLGEPRTVQATVRRLLHAGYEVEDTAFVTLDFGGSLAKVSLTWAARRREILFHFVGERGEIVGNEDHLRVHADTIEEFTFEGMSRDSSHSEWYAPLLREFTHRVRTGQRGTVALEEAVFVTRLITRAYESSRGGRTLPLVPDAAEPRPEEAVYALASTAEIPAPETPATAAPPPSRRSWAGRGLALALLVAAVGWTFHDVDAGQLVGMMASASLFWIGLAAAVNLGVLCFQAARWLAVVRPAAPVATLGDSFKAMMVGFTVSMVVPARAGELARAHYFGLRTGLSRTAIFGSIVLDHLVNAAGLLTGLAVLPLFIGVPDWIQSGGWVALALFAVGATAVALLRPSDKAILDPSREGLPVRRIASVLARIRQGLTGARHPRALGLSFGASLVAWALEVNVTGLALRAMGLQLPLSAVFLVLLAVNLALVFPVAPPGNLGTLELGATLALLGFGVSKERALAFALCYHLLQVVPIAIMGGFFASRMGLSFRKSAR